MFIPKPVAKRIRLIRPLGTFFGTFTAGHEFNIVEETERGFHLIDDDGNTVTETGPFISYEVISWE